MEAAMKFSGLVKAARDYRYWQCKFEMECGKSRATRNTQKYSINTQKYPSKTLTPTEEVSYTGGSFLQFQGF